MMHTNDNKPWQGRFRNSSYHEIDEAQIRQLRDGMEQATRGLVTVRFEEPLLFTMSGKQDGKLIWTTRGAHCVRAIIEVLGYLDWKSEELEKRDAEMVGGRR